MQTNLNELITHKLNVSIIKSSINKNLMVNLVALSQPASAKREIIKESKKRKIKDTALIIF